MTWVLAVALGGALGALGRYGVELMLPERRTLPWALIVVNVAGSALAGFVWATPESTTRTFVLVGVCGAFTTFSGWMADVVFRGFTLRAAASLALVGLGSVWAFALVAELAHS